MIGRNAWAGVAAIALAASAGTASAQENMAAVFAAQDKIPDTPGSGPYPATMEVDPALPDHVVYRPADLAAVGAGKLGVFAWGNGACAADGASARLHLAEVASHGYLVVAPGQWRSGPGARAPRQVRTASPENDTAFTFETSYTDVVAGLDWALAENAREGSPYHGLIDPSAVAVGGFSCGGVQAMRLAGDPRIGTVVMQNTGLFVEQAAAQGEMVLPKSALETLHTPVLYVLGGPTDIAYANGMDDFGRIAHVPAAMVDVKGVGHGGTYFEPNGGKAAQVVVAWLEWQLRGDAEAAKSFLGEDCRLCSDPAVEIEIKNLP